MSIDVVDLRSFYASPLGRVACRFVGRIIGERWRNCAGLSVIGLGYATPYMVELRESSAAAMAFMPAEQGVVNWPPEGRSASTLIDVEMLPLPDSCIDRVLVVHALESAENPREMLSEIWRVLTPGGRLIVVAPSRRGLWARLDTTPFGHGQPYSKSQMHELMRKTLFSPVFTGEALYVPPFERPALLRTAAAFESVGARLSLPGAGVHIVEATKQLYRPVTVRRSLRRALPNLQTRPALAPWAGRVDSTPSL